MRLLVIILAMALVAQDESVVVWNSISAVSKRKQAELSDY